MNTIKDKLNILGRGYVKGNSAGGEIISFMPDIPMMGYLDDYIFIFTIPSEDQKFAPAYCRLQDKQNYQQYASQKMNIMETLETIEFSEIRELGILKENKQKRGDIIICAPKKHILVDFSKLVCIATIPAVDKNTAPCYFRKKTYEKSKLELESFSVKNTVEKTKSVESKIEIISATSVS